MKNICESIELLNNEQIFSKVNLGFFKIPSDKTHSMYNNLYKYVEQRVPIEVIKNNILGKKRIIIYGIYPTNTIVLQNYSGVHEYHFITHSTGKLLNYVRPKYFESNEAFVILVPPGRDYVAHYVSMIRYVISLLNNNIYFNYLSVYFNKDIEISIPQWTNLDRFVCFGDIVILGYVDEMQSHLSKYMQLLDIEENLYYLMKRYCYRNKMICFLGVKYSYWGNISRIIANALCKKGVSEIIYLAKLGDMINPKNLYNKIYSATSFYLIKNTKIISYIKNFDNTLINIFPELNTGAHVSVPTVLEEQYSQIDIAKSLKINSIDNEISQIMHAVHSYNNLNNTSIKFFNLHFSTDYVRNSETKNLYSAFDLSNNKSYLAYTKKTKVLKRISDYLFGYLSI